MAQVEVENMEDNAALFMAKMGFPHNADGLDLSDDQLINFLLLCHHSMVGIDGEDYDDDYADVDEEMMEVPSGGKDTKIKVMKLDGGNVHEMMNKLLGGH